MFGGVVDLFLDHEVSIARAVPDSMVRIVEGERVVLRRARGSLLAGSTESALRRGPGASSGRSRPRSPRSGSIALREGHRVLLAPPVGDLGSERAAGIGALRHLESGHGAHRTSRGHGRDSAAFARCARSALRRSARPRRWPVGPRSRARRRGRRAPRGARLAGRPGRRGKPRLGLRRIPPDARRPARRRRSARGRRRRHPAPRRRSGRSGAVAAGARTAPARVRRVAAAPAPRALLRGRCGRRVRSGGQSGVAGRRGARRGRVGQRERGLRGRGRDPRGLLHRGVQRRRDVAPRTAGGARCRGPARGSAPTRSRRVAERPAASLRSVRLALRPRRRSGASGPRRTRSLSGSTDVRGARSASGARPPGSARCGRHAQRRDVREPPAPGAGLRDVARSSDTRRSGPPTSPSAAAGSRSGSWLGRRALTGTDRAQRRSSAR